MAMKWGIYQIFLIAVNIVHMLLGTGIAIEGIFFMFKSNIFQEDIEFILGLIEVNNGNVDALFTSLADIFIVIGLFIFGIGFLGFIGAYCKSKWMLVLFAVLVMLLMVILAVGIGLFASFKGAIDEEFYEDAITLLKEQYSSSPAVSKGFNKIFQTFRCCGMSDASDVIECAYPLPKECCSGEICTLENAYQGCIPKLDELFTQYNEAFIGVGTVTMLFQVLCVSLAIVLCRNNSDGEYVSRINTKQQWKQSILM